MTQLYTNNAASTLAVPMSSLDTSLTLATGDGAKFPSPTGFDFFLLTLYQKSGASEINHEIVLCTARSGDSLTVVRAQEGTTARSFAIGDPVELRVTAGAMTRIGRALPAEVGVIGSSRALVKADFNIAWVVQNGAALTMPTGGQSEDGDQLILTADATDFTLTANGENFYTYAPDSSTGAVTALRVRAGQTVNLSAGGGLWWLTGNTASAVNRDWVAREDLAIWRPPGNSATVPAVVGMGPPVALGTATTRTTATTNAATRARRLGYVSAATAAAFCGHYLSQAQYTLGTDAREVGGFDYTCRFVPSDAAAVSGARMFVGIGVNLAAPTNVEPSALANYIGVGQLSTSANLHVVYGGNTAQTPIDLGTNFPANGLSTSMYELRIQASALANNRVRVTVRRIGTDFVYVTDLTGTAGTALPFNTVLLAPRAWRCNNATLLACGLDIAHVHISKEA